MFVAHHDAANGGLIFRPELTRLVADRSRRWYARQQHVAADAAAGGGRPGARRRSAR